MGPQEKGGGVGVNIPPMCYQMCCQFCYENSRKNKSNYVINNNIKNNVNKLQQGCGCIEVVLDVRASHRGPGTDASCPAGGGCKRLGSPLGTGNGKMASGHLCL